MASGSTDSTTENPKNNENINNSDRAGTKFRDYCCINPTIDDTIFAVLNEIFQIFQSRGKGGTNVDTKLSIFSRKLEESGVEEELKKSILNVVESSAFLNDECDAERTERERVYPLKRGIPLSAPLLQDCPSSDLTVFDTHHQEDKTSTPKVKKKLEKRALNFNEHGDEKGQETPCELNPNRPSRKALEKNVEKFRTKLHQHKKSRCKNKPQIIQTQYKVCRITTYSNNRHAVEIFNDVPCISKSGDVDQNQMKSNAIFVVFENGQSALFAPPEDFEKLFAVK